MAALPQVLSQSHGDLALAQIVASGNGQDTEVAGSVAKGASTHHQVSECNQYLFAILQLRFFQFSLLQMCLVN